MREMNTNISLIMDWISIIFTYEGYIYGLSPVRDLPVKLPGRRYCMVEPGINHKVKIIPIS
jgi:hypothetical protein